MKYPKKTIGEICKYTTSGGTPKTSIRSYYEPPIIPWLTTKEVNYNRIYKTNSAISSEGLERSSAKLIPENSVIVAMYGQGDTAGRVAINKIPLTTNQACCNIVVDENKADYRFVFFALSTLYDKLVSLKNGGAQPNLNAGIIRELEIPCPELEIQHRIADSLSAYDDLIENNQKQIKLLEEAAQRLYKEWFVDLRFPGYEHTPVVDGVPEGWQKKTAYELSQVLRRGISPKYNDEAQGIVINQKCIRQTVVSFDEARKQEKQYPVELGLQNGDTVICSTGAGTLGRVGQIFGEYPNTTLDTHVTLVRANELIGKQYLFWSLKQYQQYLMEAGKGSTNQLELSRDTIGSCGVLLPSNDLLKQFEELAEGIHKKIGICARQNELLREKRDQLLPRLMNGEIEV